MGKAADRRIQMTKRMLEEELVRASAFRDPEEISIKQICEGAGVSRVTFYKYYGSVKDLMDETAETALSRVIDADGYQSSENMEDILRYILLNRSLYLLLIEKGYYEKFMEKYLLRQIHNAGITDENREITKAQTQYAVSGLTGLMHWCLSSQPDIAPKKLAAMILKFHQSWNSDVLEMRNL